MMLITLREAKSLAYVKSIKDFLKPVCKQGFNFLHLLYVWGQMK